MAMILNVKNMKSDFNEDFSINTPLGDRQTKRIQAYVEKC